MGLEEEEPFPFASPTPAGFSALPTSPNKGGPRKMDVEEIRWWSAQMLLAIEWVHEQGYAHR